LRELPRAAVLARQRADAQLAALYRERDIERARAYSSDSRRLADYLKV